MTFDPAAALVHYHALLDAHDVNGVARLLAPEVHYVSAGLGDVTGREAVLQSMRDYFATCPDHQAFDDEVKALSPRVAQSLWRLRGTNRHTGVVVERHGIETVTFDADGLVLSILVEDRGETHSL